jgi:hypothetical protein
LEEAHRTGIPLFRPLVLNYQDDESTYNLDDEFMIGDDLLVAPVLKPIWFDVWFIFHAAVGTTFGRARDMRAANWSQLMRP